MMNSKTLKFVALTLILATATSFTPAVTFAATNNNTKVVNKSIDVKKSGKSNFKIWDKNLAHVMYTYDEDGKSYKVVESMDSKLTNGNSKIYVKNIETGDYELDSTLTTTVGNGKVTIKTTDVKTNNTTTDSLDLSAKNLNKMKQQGGIHLDYREPDENLTDWEYSAPFFGSSRIKRYTLIAVTGVIAGVIGSLGTPISGGASGAIGAVAGAIVADEIPLVFWGQDVFYKYIIGTSTPGAERSLTTFYSDSGRNNQIGDTIVNEYYSD